MKHTGDNAGTPFNPSVQSAYEGRQFYIRVDLPGVTEEQIRIDIEKTAVTLSVSRNGVMEKKTIRIPEGSRLFRKRLSDGILEIILEKP